MSHDRMLTETDAALPAQAEPIDSGAAAPIESPAAGLEPLRFEPSVDRDAWAWATEHGAPEKASTVQLVSWLAREELPPHTLVWRPGWGEWLPAMQVAELAAAFPRVTPGSRRVARAAFDAAVTPPHVPIAHYPRLRLLAKDVLSETPPPPAVAGMPQGLAPAQAGRRALRDLDQAQQDLVTSQVPAAAMLEAALAMKRLGTRVAPGQGSWGRLELGKFGDAALQSASPPSSAQPRTLSALAVAVPTLTESEATEQPRRRSSGYGGWLLFGALVGGALGLASIRWPEVVTPIAIAALKPALPPALESPPPAPLLAVDATPRAVAPELPPVAPASVKKPPGIVQVRRSGELAVQQALRVTKNDAFDRVVFEFRERVPGYHLEYIDKPVRGCGAGDARRIEGDGWLEVRFSPAAAHTEGGAPTLRAREFKPALSIVREIERTCDFEGVVTWVIGTAAAQRFRTYEMSSPPRLVVQIEH